MLPTIGVIQAVEFHNKGGLVAVEIRNVGPERMLPTESQTTKAPAAQVSPEDSLGH
ncbi:hypothetical protein PHYC_01476 [Phycisphaerales bacterium]|nr:hypothetical protein PHYC_01476 [Phycisphaerales bacterium]